MKGLIETWEQGEYSGWAWDLKKDGVEASLLRVLRDWPGAATELARHLGASADYTDRKVAASLAGVLEAAAPAELLAQLYVQEVARWRSPPRLPESERGALAANLRARLEKVGRPFIASEWSLDEEHLEFERMCCESVVEDLVFAAARWCDVVPALRASVSMQTPGCTKMTEKVSSAWLTTVPGGPSPSIDSSCAKTAKSNTASRSPCRAELHGTAVSEHAPDFRARHSGTLRVRARLAPDLFSVAEYSLYADSWGMLAHTGRLRASFSFGGGSQWTTVAEVRGHTQTGVLFYRRRYDTLPEAPVLRTGEKELGPLWSALGSLHLDWTPQVEWAERFRVGLGADVLHLRYLDHPVLQQRTAVVGMLDVSWEN